MPIVMHSSLALSTKRRGFVSQKSKHPKGVLCGNAVLWYGQRFIRHSAFAVRLPERRSGKCLDMNTEHPTMCVSETTECRDFTIRILNWNLGQPVL